MKAMPPPFDVLGEIHDPGIYFGMSDEEYHADPSLSTSRIRTLSESVEDFWATSWMNPLYERVETDAMSLGSAYHKRILEGSTAFYKEYTPALSKDDFKDLLVTADDIKKTLAVGGYSTKGAKPALTERLLDLKPSALIWDVLVARHAFENADKILLKKEAFDLLEYAAAFIEKHPEMGRAFSGGYPEVAIFWVDEETGVPMKAKLDYLKSQAIVDFKTFSNPLGKPLDRAIITAIAGRKYHIQVFVYTEAIRNAVTLAAAGAIFGVHDPEFIKNALTHTEHKFLFVFQKTGIAPAVRWKLFPQLSAFDCGRIAARTQIQTFADCVETFGTDTWIDLSPLDVLDDDAFPMYMFD